MNKTNLSIVLYFSKMLTVNSVELSRYIGLFILALGLGEKSQTPAIGLKGLSGWKLS